MAFSAPSHALRRLLLAASLGLPGLAAMAQEPPFDATADTVFDIIRADDPTGFVCLEDAGRTTRQMWDKRIDGERDLRVFLFRAHFNDSAPIDIVLNPEFGTAEAARAEAHRYGRPLGQVPAVLRSGFRQLGIHRGDRGFHGGAGKVFLYQDRVTRRIAEHHLEESLFHEAVHASLDARFAGSPEWRRAQAQDGGFVTRYAARHPDREDLAESLLFTYALLRHPGRIPPADSAAIERTMPARIAFLARLLDTLPPPAAAAEPPVACR